MQSIPREILTLIMDLAEDSRPLFLSAKWLMVCAPPADVLYWRSRTPEYHLPKIPTDLPIETFIAHNNLPMVRHLFHGGADALIVSAGHAGHVDIVDYLSQYCSDIGLFHGLLAAVESSKMPVVKRLRKYDLSGQRRRNAVLSYPGVSSLYNDIRNVGLQGNENILDGALLLLAGGQDLPEILALIDMNGLDEIVRDGTLLFVAAAGGSLEIVKYLHEKGADLVGNPNILYASVYSGVRMLEYVHAAGVDLTAGDDEALIRACAVQDGPEVVRYLHQAGANLTARNNAPLMCAAGLGPVSTIEYLHQNGVDLAARGGEALIRAVCRNRLDVVTYLVQHGVDVRERGNEALAIAHENHMYDMISLLRDFGAWC
jgi:hypothetical protein